MARLLLVSVFVAGAITSIGCGAGLPEIVPVVSFPTADDLRPEIARGARDDGSADPVPPRAEVEAYVLPRQVPGEVPGAIPAFGTGNVPVDHGLVAQAMEESGSARVVSTAGMACAADRLAAFVAEHGAQPPRDLLDFILGRCGVTSVGAQVLVLQEGRDVSVPVPVPVPVPDGVPVPVPVPDGVPVPVPQQEGSTAAGGYRTLHDQLRRRLEGRPVPFEVEIGEAHFDAAGRRSFVVVYAPRRAALSASALPDGRYLIAGRVEGERVRALGVLVNQGAYGVAPCEADSGAELPDLRFTCSMNRHDASARVDVVVVPRERLLPHRVASIVLHRDDEASLAWVPQPELPPSATDTSPAHQLASAVDAARDDAGRDPLPYWPGESARQEPLFEAWLTAEREGDREGADRARLALLAGWQVDAAIVSARLFIGDAAATDPRAHVRRSLAQPWARRLLLSDQADSIAAAAAEGHAAITIFRAWHDEDGPAHREAWAAHLAVERTRHGLSPMTDLDDVLDLQQEADRVTAGELHPREALDNAMARIRGRLGRTVRGWYVEAYDPRWVVLPDAFLDSGATDVALGVAYVRPDGAAWGQLVFFVCAIAAE